MEISVTTMFLLGIGFFTFLNTMAIRHHRQHINNLYQAFNQLISAANQIANAFKEMGVAQDKQEAIQAATRPLNVIIPQQHDLL